MKEIFKKAKEITLTKQEKDFLKGFLLSHIEKNPAPVRNARFSRLQLLENKIGALSGFFRILKTAPALNALILILIIMAGGATAFAARGALPDEFLYPVKINVIEKIMSAAVSEEDKALFEIKAAGKRLRELEILTQKNRLNPGIIEKTENRITRHIEKAAKISLNLKKEEKAAELDLSLETMLFAHREITKAINIDDKSSANREVKLKIESVRNKIEERAEKAGEERRIFEKKLKSAEGGLKIKKAEEKKAKAEKAVSETRILVDKNKKNIGENIAKETERLVKEAEDNVKEGGKKISEGNAEEAFTLFQKAEMTAKTINEITDTVSTAPDIELKNPLRFEFNFEKETKDKEKVQKNEGGNDNSNSGKREDESGSGKDNKKENERGEKDNSGKSGNSGGGKNEN